jgi:hypothetical protein
VYIVLEILKFPKNENAMEKIGVVSFFGLQLVFLFLSIFCQNEKKINKTPLGKKQRKQERQHG